MNWNQGYVTEIDYTQGYYRELSPLHLHFSCLSQGQSVISQPLRYLELAFGRGVSLNVHAAANEGEFWGNDFNPAHVIVANDMAKASGANLTVLEDSFEELSLRRNLPMFNVIVLHGVWTWVNRENQKTIRTIIRQHLVPGGIVYISYNTYPGWASKMPLRHLLYQISEVGQGSMQNILGRVSNALDLVEKMRDAKAGYFIANPAATALVNDLKTMSGNYVVHEYMNADWQPEFFSEIATALSEAKLSYAATASLLDVLGIGMTPEMNQIINSIADVGLREMLRDFGCNQLFRRDIFVRGLRALTARQREESLGIWRVMLSRHPEKIDYSLKTPQGLVNLQHKIYKPIVDALHQADGPQALQALVASTKLSFSEVLEALMVLMSSGQVALAQAEVVVERVRQKTDRLNDHLFQRAVSDPGIGVLASPVTGGGIHLSHTEMLILKARKEGLITPETQAKKVWESWLKPFDRRLLKDGKALESVADNLAELKAQAVAIEAHTAGILKSAGVL